MDFTSWIGRRRLARAHVTAERVSALAATLNREDISWSDGMPLPLLWHWTLFHEATPQSRLAEDGHPRRGDFLPPALLPRRMWAGGQVDLHRALLVGSVVERTSVIQDVVHKTGSSGDLLFVTVRHRITQSDALLLDETQQIVYRNAQSNAAGGTTRAAPENAAWAHEVTPDPVLLFRYSALTFNAHRIHYDRAYSTEVEGYAGLVVQAPLTATLMLESLRRASPRSEVTRFTFRAMHPLFDMQPFRICGRPAESAGDMEVRAENAAGVLCMRATVGRVQV